MTRVLAMRSDGSISYCTCPPELRGKGRCDHTYHQIEGETEGEFIDRISCFIKVSGGEDRTTAEITKELIENNALSFNQDPNWGEVITPDILGRYFRLGKTVFDGQVIQETEVNEDGDVVDHLYIEGKFGDFQWVRGATPEQAEQGIFPACDFGCVPHVDETGVFTIKGVPYRCLPVVSRDKVGYGQGFNKDGVPTVWLYQEDGNLGISIPLEGDTCTIFGAPYSKDFIMKTINGHMNEYQIANEIYPCTPEQFDAVMAKKNSGVRLTPEENKIFAAASKGRQLALLYSTLDNNFIKERCPEYGSGDWMSSLKENFQPDQINDLTYRRVFTYQDQVQKELVLQANRMGVTLRNSMIDKVPVGKDDSGKEIFEYRPKENPTPNLSQTNNTKNIKQMLLGRSNVQMAETLNPLSAYSQAHKVSLVGIEGYNKDNCPDRLRMVGDSLKGISDPLDQSSGKGVGLSIFLKGSDVENGVIRKNSAKDCYSLSDFVPFRNHNNPNRVSMATSQMRQAMVLDSGEDPRMLGDPVSDKAWASISGAKMGRNLKIVYLPGEKEWEDSSEISESAARKLAASKTFTFGTDKRYKNGQMVHAGDKIGNKVAKYDGVLKQTSNGFEMTVSIPFTPGNKLAGRYGNKVTIGRIRPDSEMPKVWNPETKQYEPAEVIMSPLSIGKRGNIGSIMETQNGSLDSSTVTPVKLPNGKTVKANNGTQFIMRLNQISQEKNHANAGDLTEGREAKARFGEMESILMSTTETRRRVLNFLKNQGTDEEARLDSLMKAIGVHKDSKMN